MPKIGQVDVPNTLWEALVNRYAKDFTQMAFDLARRNGETSLTYCPDQPNLEASEATITHMYGCVAALVRMQSGDFLSDDETLRKSDYYCDILKSAQLHGDQMAYDAIVADKQLKALKALIESNWKDMNTDLHPPF